MARHYYSIFIIGLISLQIPGALAQDLAHSRESSYYTFIYRISNEQAEKLYTDMWNLENSFLHSLHDHYPTDSTYRKKLPVGHYLFISSTEGRLRGELQSVNNVDVKILSNQRDLVMIFYDSTGNEIPDAEVTIKQKRVPYHAPTKTYRLKKSNRRGVVTVDYAGHRAYFQVDKQYNSNFFIRSGRKIIGTFPFNHLASPVFYIKNNVRSVINGGRLSAPGLYHRVAGVFKPRPQTGYIAFNKPEYKPGDTVRLKAYIANLKGRPFNREVVINLNKYYPDAFSRKLTSVRPFSNGAYKFDFVLVDSMKLQLDNSYTVELADRKKRHLISGSFQFEDYALKSNNYSVRSENAGNGRPATLYLKGTDSNDMPLFDVRIEILLRPSSVKTYYHREIFIPDSLWFYETKLESLGETRVVIPDTIMPDVAMGYDAIVSFLNTENERVVKQVTLSFDKERLPVALELENDSVRISAGKDLECGEIRLEVYDHSGMRSKPITLPHVEKLNHFATQYGVMCGDKTLYIPISEKPDQLQVLANRTRDSLFVGTENPRKISLRYFLFRNQQLILTGEGQQIAIKRKAGIHEHYNLSVQYVWAGQSQSKEFSIAFDRKNLDIRIEHPPLVYPGQTTPFEISVTDAMGKPVQNVDLTAYAITKKFTSQNVPSVPDLAERAKQRTVLNTFSTQTLDNDILKRLDFTYWKGILGLDSLMFYQFLFPDDGYFEERTPSSITQFAPFVIRYADIDPVIVIYVDGQPVYYKGVETIQPYSFAIKPGKHKIELRLRNALVTVPGVQIDSAQKLIFSLDRDRLPAHCHSVEMPDQFTEEELKKLGRYFVSVKADIHNKRIYIRQADRYHLFGLIPRSYSTANYLAGPFYPGKATYFQKDAFSLTFDYEPYDSYEFKDSILKLREFNFRKSFQGSIRWYATARPPFQDEVLTQARIEDHWESESQLRINAFDRFPDFMPRSAKTGKLTLDYRGGSVDQFLTKATFIVNLDDPDEYYIFPHIIKETQFNTGRYQALIILNDKKYIRADSIVIHPFGTKYYNLAGYELHAADSLSMGVLDMIEHWSSRDSYILREREMELQRLRSLYYQETSASILFTHVVTGKVTDETGEGVPGVNVVVKGTAVGTATDAAGYYSVKCPPDGALIFSFIGYMTIEQPIQSQSTIDAQLVADVSQLQEVVVVGYGMQSSRHLASAMALQGRAAGVSIRGSRPGLADSVSIRIRGLTSVNGNQEPLVILDGRIVKMSDVNNSQVTAVDIIKGSDATALYGSRASNGVLLLSTKAGATKAYLKEMSRAVALAPPIPETLPGNALRRNFRDYAFWQPTLRTDENGKSVFNATFPDDITGWNAYVLGMASKRRTGQISSSIQSYKPLLAQLAQPNFLIQGDEVFVLGKITNYSQEGVQLTRTIKVDGHVTKQDVVEVRESKVDSIHVVASGSDSLAVEYTVTYNKYKDGELRKIPVLKKGALEASGAFLMLDTDTTFSLHFNNPNETVKLYAQADVVDVLLDEINYLKNYPYECNEQMASKLRAFLLEKQVQRFKQGRFKNDREIQKIVRRLVSSQNHDGSWSWWKNGEGEVWITLHVTEALLKAEREGYGVAFDKEAVINYLGENLSAVSIPVRLTVMNYLAEQGQTLKVKDFADSIRTSLRSGLNEKLLAQKLLQSMGFKPDWKWLNTLRSRTIKGNYYWGGQQDNVNDNAVLNTLIVHQIAVRDKVGSNDLIKIRNYFLEQRKKHWRNTYESALILEAVLPGIIHEKPSQQKPQLLLTGSVNKTVTAFPFELPAGTGSITVAKTGNAPVYFTAYREFWNSSPGASDDSFVVRTAFGNDTLVLAAGKPARLSVHVTVKNDAEYVMIEVPVPAGCSYESKAQSRQNGEVHREYFGHKTNIYCKYLKKGTYSYFIDLLPRYSGKYTLNPAVAECMYFPTLYGREGTKDVTIK